MRRRYTRSYRYALRMMIASFVVWALFFAWVLAASAATPPLPAASDPAPLPLDPRVDVRYCGAPIRDPDGSIHRSSAVLYAFRKQNPCPPTGKTDGACPGWSINHIRPLASGGCDAVFNLMWLPNEIKSCAKPYCIDRWERTYWTEPRGIVAPFTAASAASAP